MVLAPMRGQNIPGFSALLFQLSRFFQRQPKVVSDQSSITSLRGRGEFEGVLVEGQQIFAHFAVHVALTATKAIVSPNRFVARGCFLDYLVGCPRRYPRQGQRQVFDPGRFANLLSDSSSCSAEGAASASL